MMENPTVRVFVSSPSDVRPERLIAERVVKRLAREFSYHFRLEAVLWEREPLLATHHFQDLIVPPHETDIVVTVLWSRLGVPLPEAKYLGAISKAPVTGTEWEFEDAVASYQQRGLPELLLYRKRAKVTVTVELGDRAILEEQQHQSELVEEFMRRWFRSLDGKSFVAASREFADATEFESLLEEHLRGLLSKRLTKPGDIETPATITWHQGSPYRGLEPFEIEHASIFFGRTRARNEIREVLARQIERGCSFVLVIGASGSGKSSLVKAGVLPDLLLPGMVGRVALCRYAVTRPGATTAETSKGALAALAHAFFVETALPEVAQAPLEYTPDRLRELFDEAPTQSAQPIRQGLSAAGQKAELTERGEARLVLVIDQLEELFTAGITQELRERYIAALDALARSGLVWIIATMRSDFFDRISTLPSLAALSAGEGTYLLAPPDAADIGQIIRRPAREAGLRFDIDERAGHSLDEEIREAAAKDPASLPLLEYLLDQLWHQRNAEGLLTFQSYQALKGLEGAIGERAEQVLRDLPDTVRQAFPTVLRALVTVGQSEAALPTARLVPLSTFAEGSAERSLVEALIHPQARILVAYGDRSAARVRVAHEALLTHWKRARLQIAADRRDLRIRARLELDEARWREAQPQDRAGLLLPPGLRLLEGEELLARRRAELDPTLVTFIDGSVRAARQAGRRKIRQRRIITFASVAAAVVLACFAVVAGWQWRQAEIGQIKAVSASANAIFMSNKQLEGITTAIPAARTLSRSWWQAFWPDTELKDSVNGTIRALLAGATEHNRLSIGARVAGVAFAPDDKTLATWTLDNGKLQLWKSDGAPFNPPWLKGISGVSGVAFSRDGKIAIADGNKVRVGNLGDGESWNELSAGEDGISAIAFSADGRKIAAATTPDRKVGRVRLWDLDDDSSRTLDGPDMGVPMAVAFSPDGAQIAVTAWNGAFLWRTDGTAAPRKLEGDGTSVNAVAFSPDGSIIATGGVDKMVRLWKSDGTPATKAPLSGHADAVWGLSFSPDGEVVASASSDRTVKLWQIDGALLSTLAGHGDAVRAVAFSHNGKTLASASDEGTVKLWALAGPSAALEALTHDQTVYAAAFSPNGRMILTTSGHGGLTTWDPDGKFRQDYKFQYGPIIAVAFSRDGKMVATAAADRTVWLSAIEGRKLSGKGMLEGQTGETEQKSVLALSFSPNGKSIAAGGVSGEVRIWSTDDPGRRTKPLLTTMGAVIGVDFSPDGKNMVVSDASGKVVVVDSESGARVLTLQAGGSGSSPAYGVRYSPDGETIAAYTDNTVERWTAHGKLLGPLSDRDSAVVGFTFSRDGKWIASTSKNGTVKIWTADGNRVVNTLRGHEGTGNDIAVNRVAFSPDGKWIASASEGRTVILWNWQKDLGLDGTVADACRWIRDYLTNNSKVTEDDRHLCDGVHLHESPPGDRAVSLPQPEAAGGPSAERAGTHGLT
jgi:WD40 repeat protein